MVNIFITATDTDAGKTYVAIALVHALVKQGKRVTVFKPISAGCEQVGNKLINEDARLLMNAANCQQSIDTINPIAFLLPIAPHIAAKQCKKIISLDDVFHHYQIVKNLTSQFTITEGAGGWRLPLGNGQFLSDFAKKTDQKVILVVNMKLGCLNHAVLSYQAIIADGLQCIAWVANCPEPMPYLEENISELELLLPIPKIAQLDFEENIDKAAQKFNLSSITALAGL